MENLNEHIQDHPADTLAKALDRAGELLSTLGNLYESSTDAFAGGNTFIAHAVATVSVLVSDARLALDDLHHNCDLTLLDDSASSNGVIEVNFQDENAEEVAEHTETEMASMEDTLPIDSAATEHAEEQVAQTYLELLRKLTAAEIFAAEQQALSVPGTSEELLPLLQSLREDIQKIHKVA